MCTMRVKLFRQYLACEHSQWDPQTEIDEWEEAEPLKTKDSPAAEDATNVKGSGAIDRALDVAIEPNVQTETSIREKLLQSSPIKTSSLRITIFFIYILCVEHEYYYNSSCRRHL
ncbi:hypothetical protein Ddye_010484 [Dipteronia dyeriana]|uniref:Uncharacterized protein n=1 Tax=Dipteronia dyeriana TaxID=168575 RepID=A0AAE0CNA6_9ROSI|nr:hypothetical protein Ddye_010484 [Dipteronia dyeriana]